MSKKLKILVCSESSRVSSGFGVYNKFLLEGLWNSQKFDIAEFASYGVMGDKEKFNIPWKYYPNMVLPNDPRINIYNSSPDNCFGKWRFDRVLLDFRPDVVIDVRDFWMSSYQGKSPLRKYFHWILMPTVDSEPQHEEWLDTYVDADAVFTYSDWARGVLENQTCGSINYVDTTSPGVDLECFSPIQDTAQVKHALRIDHDYTIIGTVMRNQKRKLYPELIRVFEEVIAKLEAVNSPKAKSTILYCHTSFPDAGWDFTNLVKNSPVGNRIYFTYSCRNCGNVFASVFSGPVQYCVNCKQKSATMPNVSNGVDNIILGKIIGSFDIYIQYAICEGFGMPQVEAGGCGVPILTVNYSAMEDVINKLEAIPINIGARFKELETSAIRVYPDHNDAVSKLLNMINLPENVRKKNGYKIRQLTEKYYSWENSIDKWINYLSNIELKNNQGRWDKPPEFIDRINIDNIDKNLNVYELVYSLQHSHLNKLNIKMNDYWLLKQIQAAQDGFYYQATEPKHFEVKDVINNFNQLIDNHNMAETARTNIDGLSKEDYIDYANKQ